MTLTLTNADVVSRLKLLSDIHLKADSGSTTTAVSSKLAGEPDITNQYICFISGDNEGVDAIITDFATETGTITFNVLTNTVTNVDEFCILDVGFQSDVSQAYSFMVNHFRNNALDIDLFLTTPQLKEAHIYKTIELICASRMNDGDAQDAYFVNYERFKDMYTTEVTTLIADYDANEDGSISEDEEDTNVGQVNFTR